MTRKTFSKEKRYFIWHKYRKRCAYCGEKIEFKDMQIDHIVPQHNYFNWYKQYELNNYNKGIPDFILHLTVNDVNHSDNLNPSCRKCNKYKAAFSIDAFKKEIKLQIHRLNEYITQYQRAKRFGLVVETKNEVVFYFEKINK